MKLKINIDENIRFDSVTGVKIVTESVWLVDEDEKDYDGSPKTVALLANGDKHRKIDQAQIIINAVNRYMVPYVES